ncbi:MAG: hypothetical protein AAGJ97_13470 [Planctomycetota bacterium]
MRRLLLPVACLVVGYCSAWVLPAGPLEAQSSSLSNENLDRLRKAQVLLSTVQGALVSEGAYVPAIRGLNTYATLSGGTDAISGLESGRGVDPVTFAGLHAGLANDEVAPRLGEDAEGRLTYNGRVVRMHSIRTLEEAFSTREELVGGDLR